MPPKSTSPVMTSLGRTSVPMGRGAVLSFTPPKIAVACTSTSQPSGTRRSPPPNMMKVSRRAGGGAFDHGLAQVHLEAAEDGGELAAPEGLGLVAVLEGAQDGIAPQEAFALLKLGGHAAMLFESLEHDEDAHAGEDHGADEHIHAVTAQGFQEEDEASPGEQVAAHAGALAGPQLEETEHYQDEGPEAQDHVGVLEAQVLQGEDRPEDDDADADHQGRGDQTASAGCVFGVHGCLSLRS